MSITDYTFRLLLLFLPGIISFAIIDNYTIHRETKLQHRVVYSLLLGFCSYSIWMIFAELCSLFCHAEIPVQFITSLLHKDAEISPFEIYMVSIIAVILGGGISKAINDRKLYRIARFLHISNKFPEMDAWQNFLTHYGDREYIRVIDPEGNRCYQGKLFSASSAMDRDGIVLTYVGIYRNDTGEFLRSVEAICLPQKLDTLIIETVEVRSIHEEQKQEKNKCLEKGGE